MTPSKQIKLPQNRKTMYFSVDSRESVRELVIGIDGRTLTSSTPGGIGLYTAEVVNRIRELRPAWTWVIYSHAKIKDFANFNNMHNVVVPGPAASARFRYLLSKRLARDNLDVFWGPAHLLPRRPKRIPAVVTVHDLALFNIERFFPRCGSKVRQIYLGAPVEGAQGCEFDSGQTSAKLGAKGKYFLYLGDINLRKNFDTVLRAFEKLSAIRDNVSLVIAGGAGLRLRKDILASLPQTIGERLVFTGYINEREKAYLFRHAQAFLFPSRYEGFGMPLLEAMRSGGLVITSRESCLPEVAGDAALYLENVNDSSELSNLMNQSMNLQLGEREQLLKRGELQAARFSWSDCAERTAEAIEYVARKRN